MCIITHSFHTPLPAAGIVMTEPDKISLLHGSWSVRNNSLFIISSDLDEKAQTVAETEPLCCLDFCYSFTKSFICFCVVYSPCLEFLSCLRLIALLLLMYYYRFVVHIV